MIVKQQRDSTQQVKPLVRGIPMIEKERLRSALKLLLDGREWQEFVMSPNFDFFGESNPVMRELQTLGVSLEVRQQTLGDSIARVYTLPKMHQADARRIYADLVSKPKAKCKAKS